MSTSKTTQPSRKSAARSRNRSGNIGSDFALRTTKRDVGVVASEASHRPTDAWRAAASNEELSREIVGLKLRIRALNATNSNLRRRIAELETRDTAAKPLRRT